MIEIPDKEAREKALDPKLSFIVQAPAGSGKTTLLIQRYLRLLTTVKRPEEILALTFTRKAAGEMHCRIVEALETAASGREAENENEAHTIRLAEEALLADKEKVWNLLENPSRLRVMTIDSFCASLTCQMPLLSRLGMDPVVTENPQGFYREAARRTLAMVDSDGVGGEAVRQLLRYNDNSVSALEDKLLVMLAKRDQWERHMLRGNEAGLRDDLEKALETVIEAGLIEAVEAFPASLATQLANSARYAALHVPEGHSIAGLRDITGLPPATADNLSLWKAIVDLLVTLGKTWRSQRGVNKSIGFTADKVREAVRAKEDFKALLSDLAHNDILLRAFNNVRALPEARYDDEDWKTLGALLHLLPLALTHLKKVFTEEGLLDFPAVSMAAIKALGPEDNPTDLMLLLDNTFSHILVDEYQDTSWTQVSLIKALIAGWEPDDGRTLFIVGDPMQSIYLFRDADVGLFLRARRKGVGHLKLEYIWLESNFRSEGHVVNWVNETFGGEGVFPFEEDVITGAVPYGEAFAVRGRTEKARVNIRLYRGRDDAQEAEDVLDILAKIKEDESVAILARSRTHLKVIIAELNKAGIDFLAENLDPLGDRPVIHDLFALLLALSNPVERVAWLALLRARWCGLSLADIHSICACDRDRPLWELMEEPKRVAGLSEDGAGRLLSFRTTMRKAMNLRGRMALRGLLEGLWTAFGGQAVYGDDDSMREAERFFAIVEDLDEAGVIRSPEELARRVEALYATHSARTENPLKVMTIHKAKGLEFDHVILPGLGRPPRNPDKEILYWMEGEQGLLLAPMEKKGGKAESLIYRYLAGVHKERETLERTRLFYVAATRAAKELYLFGHVDKSAEEIKAESRSFLGLIPHALSEDMVVPTEDGGELNDEARPPELHLKRLSRLWKAPSPAPPCAVAEAGGEAIDVLGETRPVFDWAGAEARHSGTAAHRYLYRIAVEGVSTWDEERVRGERHPMEAMLRGLGLNGEKAVAAAQLCINIIIKALTDERGRWILGPHEEGAAEYALTGLVEGRIRRVIIDRTFTDEKGLRWVIDYKTGEHRGGDLGGFLEVEKERYKSQLDGYAELLGSGSGEKNIRRGLYYPAIPAWIEW